MCIRKLTSTSKYMYITLEKFGITWSTSDIAENRYPNWNNSSRQTTYSPIILEKCHMEFIGERNMSPMLVYSAAQDLIFPYSSRMSNLPIGNGFRLTIRSFKPPACNLIQTKAVDIKVSGGKPDDYKEMMLFVSAVCVLWHLHLPPPNWGEGDHAIPCWL